MQLDNWKYIYKKKDSLKDLKKRQFINVACILGYYNGSKYIKEQLQSIINQKQDNLNITIFISDDNSDELFPSITDLNFKKGKNIDICYRKLKKNIGISKNFIFSLRDVNQEFDYFCFSDQDDIWYKDKIINSIKLLEKYYDNIPVLYGSRTEINNENCEYRIGYSRLVNKPLSFENALLENFAGGNTMVFNNKAKELLVSTSKDSEIAHHDWWAYIVVSGVGGNIIYDKKPSLKYRQHNINLTGSNRGIRNKFKRLIKFKNGSFSDWNEKNIKALNKNKKLLTIENQRTLHCFYKVRNSNLFIRVLYFFRSKIYRQSLMDQIGFFLGTIFNKI